MIMNASQMSAIIRAKKKKMEEEHSGAVKLSGIPEDATDHEVIKGDEATDGLNENHPKEHEEMPELPAEHAMETAPQPHDEMSPDPKQINQPEDGEVENRQAKMMKIKKMMSRMASGS